MNEYKYFCPNRPPQLGAVPKDGLQYVESWTRRKFVYGINTLAWGYAVYNRELTEDEIMDYELLLAPKEESV